MLVLMLGMPWAMAGAEETPSTDSGIAGFFCGFRSPWAACGFADQVKAPGRIIPVRTAGLHGIRLRTLPGDDDVAGSGRAERADLVLSQQATGCFEGEEQWWAHSLLFPEEYVAPVASPDDRWPWGVVFDFHHTGSQGQANFQIEVLPDPIGLRFAISGGSEVSDGGTDSPTRHWPIGPVVKNAWYHFVYHVKWSSGGDGFFNAWVNGEEKLSYRGPTLYEGQGCYLKLANYHTPVGRPVSVVHARVVRGATREKLRLLSHR